MRLIRSSCVEGRLQMGDKMKKVRDIVLIGHPFAPTGRGEDVRCTYQSLNAVGVSSRLIDLYGIDRRDSAYASAFPIDCDRRPGTVNIFHLNADEVKQAMATLTYNGPWTGYNIIYPTWELSRYPAQWGEILDTFDEIWSPSSFIHHSISQVAKKSCRFMPLACEPKIESFMSRRHFQIPENDFVFLFFYDVRSYPARKNPLAVLAAFEKLIAARPFGRYRLVLKVSGDADGSQTQKLQSFAGNAGGRLQIIACGMSDNEVKNLIRCSDCFVSLHRSEGFGRGLAESMAIGKMAIGTGYSGNLDFMASGGAHCVSYKLVSVGRDEYPFYEDQEWAEPCIDDAVRCMTALIDNPAEGVRLGTIAKRFMRCEYSFRAIGLRYAQRIEAILSEMIR